MEEDHVYDAANKVIEKLRSGLDMIVDIASKEESDDNRDELKESFMKVLKNKVELEFLVSHENEDIGNFDLENTKEFKVWEKKVEGPQIMDGGDDVPKKCPINLQDMKNPVKNRPCGHIYSADGINALISQAHGRRVGCPIAGCNKDVISNQLTPVKS